MDNEESMIERSRDKLYDFRSIYDSIDWNDTTLLAFSYADHHMEKFVNTHMCFDSPIEELFYWCFIYKADKKYFRSVFLIPQVDFEDLPYRVDFVVGDERDERKYPMNIVIECDGHDYHSSKEQIKKDNERQREIENIGYTFIRFSGSEIYNDVEKCVDEVFKKIQSLDKLFEERLHE